MPAPVLVGIGGSLTYSSVASSGSNTLTATESGTNVLTALQSLNHLYSPAVVLSISITSTGQGTASGTTVTVGGYSAIVVAECYSGAVSSNYLTTILAVLPVTAGMSFATSTVVCTVPGMTSGGSPYIYGAHVRIGLYNGVDPTGNAAWAAGYTGGTGTPLNTLAVSSAGAQLAVCAWCTEGTADVVTAPTADFTESGTNSTCGYSNGFGTVASAGTFNATATGSGAACGIVGLINGLASCDPYFLDVALLLHGDGTNGSTTFTDSSLNGVGMTYFNGGTGPPTINTTTKEFGTGSIYLPRQPYTGFTHGNNVQTGVYSSGSPLNIVAASSWTVEFAINFPNTVADAAIEALWIILFGSENGSGGSFGITLVPDGEGHLLMQVNGAGGGVTVNYTAGTWAQIAIVANGVGANKLLFYYNGSQVYTTTWSTLAYAGTDTAIYIGSNAGYSGAWCESYIDELRITNGVSRYTGSSYTVPIAAFPNFACGGTPTVPNIVGLSVALAEQTIIEAGYVVGTTTAVIGQTAQVVTTQTPTSGTSELAGTAINFTYTISIRTFNYDPEQEYTETLSWATDIIESYYGQEQRIKYRQNPRQVLNFESFAVTQLDITAIRLLLFKFLPDLWVVPSWWEQTVITSALTAGATTLNLDTTDADYRVNCFGFIRHPNKTTWETFLITGVTSTTLTISGSLANSYPVKGTQIMPARQAYAKTQTTAKTYTLAQSKVSVAFTTIDNANLAYWNTSLWPSYTGFPVLGDTNYIDGTVDEGMDRNGVVVIDNKSGVIYQNYSTDRSRPRSVKTWWTNYRQDLWSLRQLGHYLGGSQGLFWLPTNRNDLIVTVNIAPLDAGITVGYVGYTAYCLDANSSPMLPFANIRLTLVNGTIYYRAITAATVSGTNEVLTLDSPIVPAVGLGGVTIPFANVARCEFMNQMRISDDKMTFTHDHAGRAKVVINCVGIRE